MLLTTRHLLIVHLILMIDPASGISGMTPTVERALAYCGVAFVLLFLPGLLLSGLLPVISPTAPTGAAAQFWAQDMVRKQFGLAMMLAASGLQAPLGALIAIRMRQMAGRYSALAYTQIIGAGLAVLAVVLPIFGFAAASYRPDRAPEITQAFHDFGWLLLVMNWPPAILQCASAGVAVLGAARQLSPRWFGYWNLWCAFLFTGGGVTLLFKDGVFAWNGVVAFYLPASVFGVWILSMVWQLLKTTSASEQDWPTLTTGEITKNSVGQLV